MALLDEEITRRRFAVLGTQLVGAAVSAMLGIPIIGFLISPLFHQRRPSERHVGFIGDLPHGTPTKFTVSFPQEGWAVPEARRAIYVVRQGNDYKVFSNICTHMQCPVRWEQPLQQFLCPCHGGLYDINGGNIGGPPPKPLAQYDHRIVKGELYVTERLNEDI
jgi:menaquinol-cytochrome c reductase iron-sulfur subunit